MTAARRDLLAGWRGARAGRAVAATVATVATALPEVATPGNGQKTAVVATVASVAAQNGKECVARGPTDAWGLTESEKAETLARLTGGRAPAATPWPEMDFGPERGLAFAAARRAPGACPTCAGRAWWRAAGSEAAATCRTCHPPPPGAVVEAVTP